MSVNFGRQVEVEVFFGDNPLKKNKNFDRYYIRFFYI